MKKWAFIIYYIYNYILVYINIYNPLSLSNKQDIEEIFHL